MKNLPTFLKKYFWDINFNQLDNNKARQFILKRILEYGDEKAVKWMLLNYTRKEIVKFLSFARIDPRSANFWATILNIKKEKIFCLQKHYLTMRKKIWPY